MRNNNKKVLTTTVSEQVFKLLAKEAKRCLRTIPKHIEAILCSYVEAEDVSLSRNNSFDILEVEVIQ